MMTKKELAAMQAAIDRAETLAALRWTSEVLPDVMPPESGGYTQGWTFNAYVRNVQIAWSGATVHGYGEAPTRGACYRSASQNSIRLFSTKARALSALRHALEKECAAALLKIDRELTTPE